MFKRIKRAIKAFNSSNEEVYAIKKSSMTKEQVLDEHEGDGKAEFLGEGSQDEYLESVKESKGLKGIFGL